MAQKRLLKSRLPVVALSVLYFFILNIVGMIMVLSVTAERLEEYYSASDFQNEMYSMVNGVLGAEQFSWIMIPIIAAVLAISGFCYLYDRRKLDFYESLPVKRRERFRQIYESGILIFLIPYTVSLAAALMIASGFRALNTALVMAILMTFIRNTILFFGCYHIGIAASLISGTSVMASLLTAFLILSGPVMRWVLEGFQSVFYRTYFYEGIGEKIGFSPITAYLYGKERNFLEYAEFLIWENHPADLIRWFFKRLMLQDILSILAAAVVLALAVRICRKRKNEAAGTAVAFYRLRFFIKIPVAVVLGLTIAFFLILGPYSLGKIATTRSCVGILITVVVASAAGESIFEGNVRKMLQHWWHMPVAGFIAFAVFFGMKADVLGYNDYIPNLQKVSSAAISVDSRLSKYNGRGAGFRKGNYAFEKMYLTDLEAVTRLAEIGQQNIQNEDAQGWGAQILYRFKDGRTVGRQIMIPYDIDPELMDRILASDEYKKGAFPVYQDDWAENSEYGQIEYTDGFYSEKADGILYGEFADAYRRDLEKFSYSLASEEMCCGKVEFSVYTDRYVSMVYEIYPSYTNTLDFLRKNGMLTDPEERVKDTESVTVYYLNEQPAEAGKVPAVTEGQPAVEEVSVVYTDKEQIREILKSCYSYEVPTDWKGDIGDGRYMVSVAFRFREWSSSGEITLNLLKDRIPDFVRKDLEHR